MQRTSLRFARSPLMPTVMRARLLRSCHYRSVASSPVPRGQLIRRASRADRRPLRHLRGARGRSVRPHRSSPSLNLPLYRHHACASPVKALAASAISLFASLIGRVVVPHASHARSTRRGTPRPCGSAMPRAGVSSAPPDPLGLHGHRRHGQGSAAHPHLLAFGQRSPFPTHPANRAQGPKPAA